MLHKPRQSQSAIYQVKFIIIPSASHHNNYKNKVGYETFSKWRKKPQHWPNITDYCIVDGYTGGSAVFTVLRFTQMYIIELYDRAAFNTAVKNNGGYGYYVLNIQD